MRARRDLALATAAGALWLTVCAGALGQDARGGAERAAELAYAEVLFHLYSGDDFAGLARLATADARAELGARAGEAELARGSLYLSYGQYDRAAEVFEQVLAGAVDPAVHDRAWLFLAETAHRRGRPGEAAAALSRIGRSLPAALETQRRLLEAQVLMAQQRYDEALAVLGRAGADDASSAAYARYNAGVALVRLGRFAEGVRALDEVGRIETDDPELLALRDRANVAVGYAWLQSGQPAEARPALGRVRLTGPSTSKALLGAGWADVEQGRYEAALVPWTELKRRDLLDPAVQESLLAVPYAFEQLGAAGQAADAYVEAVQKLDTEIARLDGVLAAIEQGALIAGLVTDDARAREPRPGRLPRRVETRYLYELMATHGFQEALDGYRELRALERRLEGWNGSLDAFDDVLGTLSAGGGERVDEVRARVDAYGARVGAALDRQRAHLERAAVDALTAQRDRLTAYRADAQFALAAIYDRAASTGARGGAAQPVVTEGAP